MFKPLLVPLQRNIQAKPDKLDLDGIQDLDPDVVRLLQERDKVYLDKNKDHAIRVINIY